MQHAGQTWLKTDEAKRYAILELPTERGDTWYSDFDVGDDDLGPNENQDFATCVVDADGTISCCDTVVLL